MCSSLTRSLRGSFLRFIGCSEGTILPTFTLALIPLFGMVGVATHYSRASNARTGLQASLDVALLAGARDGTTNWVNVAKTVFDANMKTNGATVGTPTFSLDANRAYKGTVSGSMQTEFMRVLGVKSMD